MKHQNLNLNIKIKISPAYRRCN